MVVPIIPALNPDEKLEELVKKLIKSYDKIIIVNDGSASDELFQKLKNYRECVVLTHEINKGKGEALKTAYRYYVDHLIKKYDGVITLDADGQHSVEDTLKMSDLVLEKDKFIIGTRLFNTKATPIRNKMGNRITSRYFKMLYGVYLKDTQTGLRAFPNRLIPEMIDIEGSRFEYEINVLIHFVKKHEEIVEHNIKTIYLENSNRKSNFKVVRDSYQIYHLMWQKRK